jgi:tRNA A37 threonylcarbamoyltransferase TsaD
MNFKAILLLKEFCGEKDEMIAWAGIKRFKKKLLSNDIPVKLKSRWPLDKKAPFLKGPGLKL